MKNLLSTLLILIFATVTFAQEEYDSYKSEYWKQDFDISISEKKKKGEYRVFITVKSLDPLSKDGGFVIESSDLPQFLKSLEEAKSKYLKWSAIADEKGVTDLTKNTEISFMSGVFFLYGRSWHFHFKKHLESEFKVVKDKKLLLIRSGKATSSSNRFISVEDYVLVFSNEEEINNMLYSLSEENITKFLLEPKDEDYFD